MFDRSSPRHHVASLLCGLAVLWLAAAGQAKAQTGGPILRTERIEAQLVAMSAWAAPGSTAVVAVRQKIKPGWHTYWRNPGDSGGATTLSWRLPAGVTAGDIVWPLPARQRLQGLVNYGYEGEVFLPVTVAVPASARAESTLPLKVEALFLVCSAEMCVPDPLTLTLDLPVREGAAPLTRPYGAKIEAVLENAPRPAAVVAHASLTGDTLTLSATGGPLVGASVGHATFFPFDADIIAHDAPQFGQRGPQGLTLTLAVSPDLKAKGLTGPVSGVLATDAGAWEITATPGPPLAATAGAGSLTDVQDAAQTTPVAFRIGDALKAVAFAFLGGLILNLMPCVFPVLAMKAASLTRSAHALAEARRDGFAFTVGVLASFLALGGGLLALRAGGQAIGWGFQLQSPTVVAGLALSMLAVALNLSGVFEIGEKVQALAGSPSARRLDALPGGAGAFFTGVLAVVVAAPCTAPFMALALGAALVMPAIPALIVFLMLGLGLALPYLLVSLSPALLSRLPRPGPWMEGLRGLLAFPMYGAALWLAWVFGRQTSAGSEALMLGSGLALAFAAWLWGRMQTARAEDRSPWLPGASAALAAVAAIALAASAVAAPRETETVSEAAVLPSQPWSIQALETARALGRPVLVNFTADWCVSCKINERTALGSPRVAQALTQANAVYLKADWTRRDDVIARELQRHGRSGVPLYLLYTPGEAEPRILPQLLTEGVVIDALTGASETPPT